MKTVIISTDKSKIDLNFTHQFLTNSYWAEGRALQDVIKSIENSMCFGIYKNDLQIGFARVITDKITFAYIADVFVTETERGKGYSKLLMNEICFHEDLKAVNKWYLITKDAQELYKKYGFNKYNKPNRDIMFVNKHDLTKIEL